MTTITREKLDQAACLVAEAGLDAWLTFVRETAGGGDPALGLILGGGVVWASAFIVTPTRRVAVVGNYDADPIRASGDWDEVVPYVQGIRTPLVEALERLVPAGARPPRLAVNWSEHDVMADGLSHGMFLLLTEILAGTRFAGRLVSAEPILAPLRGRKTAAELARIRAAIAATDDLFAEIGRFARPGVTERALYDHVQRLMAEQGLGHAWDRAGDPIVNAGPQSMPGHGLPSPELFLAPGQVLHVDLGVVLGGYSSDIQRCWYLPEPGEAAAPDDVQAALEAVVGAVSAGAAALRPGAPGWQVDAAARAAITSAGYPEYLHALGHDGGTVLGPRWERYGRNPHQAVAAGEVYTLELGVMVPARGYLGIEEMVHVTDSGVDWLSQRQLSLPLLG